MCSVRRADGSSETVSVKDKAHLEELLSGIFGIKLPENTEDIVLSVFRQLNAKDCLLYTSDAADE